MKQSIYYNINNFYSNNIINSDKDAINKLLKTLLIQLIMNIILMKLIVLIHLAKLFDINQQ